MQNDYFFWVVIAACVAVLIVLITGVAGFAGGGWFNRKYSNKLMQARIILQAIAVVLILAWVAINQSG